MGKPTKLAYEIREWLNRDLLQGENYLKENKEKFDVLSE
jgi:hypothetical protein